MPPFFEVNCRRKGYGYEVYQEQRKPCQHYDDEFFKI